MLKQETHGTSAAERKTRIRERYKGIDRDRLEVIPTAQKVNVFEENVEQRVAVYVRVSTDDPNQTSSFELQKNHYTDVIDRHPGWKLVRIYADEGISGTSLAHRDQFLQMQADCESGCIDIIVTKTVEAAYNNPHCWGEPFDDEDEEEAFQECGPELDFETEFDNWKSSDEGEKYSPKYKTLVKLIIEGFSENELFSESWMDWIEG